MTFKEFFYQRVEKRIDKFYPTYEAMVEHINTGEVTIPVKDVVEIAEEYSEERELPSAFKYGNLVSVIVEPMLLIKKAKVIKVHFTDSKVTYDLEVEFTYRNNDNEDWQIGYTRFYNIDSAFLSAYSETN